MELIVIDKSRLKIILSREEMQSYGIDAMSVDIKCEEARRTLCDILEKAKHTAGFSCDCGRVFVQIFASCDGGCEMFVTSYSELSDEDEEGCFMEKTDKDSQNIRGRLRRRYAYRLCSTEELVRLCSALKERGYAEESDAYMSLDGEDIFLVLYEGAGADVSVALEFAESVPFFGMPLYISEHCMPLCEGDAVGSLSALG